MTKIQIELAGGPAAVERQVGTGDVATRSAGEETGQRREPRPAGRTPARRGTAASMSSCVRWGPSGVACSSQSKSGVSIGPGTAAKVAKLGGERAYSVFIRVPVALPAGSRPRALVESCESGPQFP